MANDLMVAQYETALGPVKLDAETVKKYLVHGSTPLTDQETMMFLQLCKYQKLNPFVGEAYAIKFGNDFQMVVGYETYKRRAEENPEYYGRTSGIVVLRKEAIVQKEGTCLYPFETLIGGWCRVTRQKNGRNIETYKEVALAEYQKFKDGKPMANWGTKPATMIEKVAVSQALRAAFPKDYQGLYTAEEATPDGGPGNVKPPIVIGTEGSVIAPGDDQDGDEKDDDRPITQEERKELFKLATDGLGKEDGIEVLQMIIASEGVESTIGMLYSSYLRVTAKVKKSIELFTLAIEGLGKEEGVSTIQKLITSEGFKSLAGMPLDAYQLIIEKLKRHVDIANAIDDESTDETSELE
jgi:phage recombination protein Bet